MTSAATPKLLKSALCTWLLACVVATGVNTDLVFKFAYYVLPASALLVPILVAALAVQKRKADALLQPRGAARSSAAVLTAYALLSVAYLMSAAVFARLLEIPWRRNKFGNEALDLGLSAAGTFLLAAAFVAGLSLIALRHLQPRSRAWAAAVSSVAMLACSAVFYFVVGVSPLVQWRP